ncbi:MAG TPA: GWxTD domain-containing protein [Bryobacteraceae bacterium]|jgi:GWxTD domain-containing protein|nr:GWxTD domain-containing protein [Bryobacteraceae bacterium]
MSELANWIHTPLARALGWALAHFLWEGAVLAAALLAALRWMRAAPARRRYTAACLILAAMPAAFAITLAAIWLARPLAIAAPLTWSPVPLGDGALAVGPARFSWAALFDHIAWLAPVWLAGVAFFYARGLAAWASVRRLRRRGVCAPAAEWQQRLDGLAARLRIGRPVTLLESCLADAPVLIGWLRPAILLPLGCLTGLSAAQVECILLHELAHVVRRDYLVNMVQSLAEGLLFYHPAVWWVSRVVRMERENCCDDRVVEWTGDARAYAATLAVLEQRRVLHPEFVLAANGGNLMQRIRRLTAESRGVQTTMAPATSAAALLVIFAAAMTALPAKLPVARRVHTPAGVAMAAAAAQDAAALPGPYRKWLTEDVAYIITAKERAEFLALTSDAGRETFIDRFWKRRDPTPDSEENEYREEHYRRIAYANEHFAGSVAGWKTDRGRLYITYGPPDEIDDHSTGSTAVPSPHQQWRYRYIEGIGANIIVEFVDRNGTGDFQMTSDPSAKQQVPDPYRKWLNEDAAYIITPQERATFLGLDTKAEHDKFIAEFWQRRGEAFKSEHYRRIAYANEHFATGTPGWKTDRGRVYIVYGPPDTVTSLDGRTVEWTYGHLADVGNNVRVQFTDSNGSGDYRMTKDPAKAQAEARELQAQLEVMRTMEMRLKAQNGAAGPEIADLRKKLEEAREQQDSSAMLDLRAGQARDNIMLAKEVQEKRAAELQARTRSMDQLNAAAMAGVRMEQTGPQTATLVVPLDSSPGTYHILAEITQDGRAVQTLERDVTGESEIRKEFPLPAGSYHLHVTVTDRAKVKNWQYASDFPVH